MVWLCCTSLISTASFFLVPGDINVHGTREVSIKTSAAFSVNVLPHWEWSSSMWSQHRSQSTTHQYLWCVLSLPHPSKSGQQSKLYTTLALPASLSSQYGETLMWDLQLCLALLFTFPLRKPSTSHEAGSAEFPAPSQETQLKNQKG